MGCVPIGNVISETRGAEGSTTTSPSEKGDVELDLFRYVVSRRCGNGGLVLSTVGLLERHVLDPFGSPYQTGGFRGFPSLEAVVRGRTDGRVETGQERDGVFWGTFVRELFSSRRFSI